MLNLSRKKINFNALLLLKILVLTLCISSLAHTADSRVKVASSKTKDNSLLLEINQVDLGNKRLKSQNTNLQTSIKKNETLYKEKLTNSKIAYLTFDDGPSTNTAEILKVLNQYGIKATFFVNGQPKLRHLYKQIGDDGHALANHTYSHDYKSIYASPRNFKKDVTKLDAFLTEITGKEPNHFLRYPGGSNNNISRRYGGKHIMNAVIKEMEFAGYTYFDWNVDSSDALAICQDKDKIVQAVLAQSLQRKNAVILMHDSKPKTTTVQALPEIIEGLQNSGFQFDVLSKNMQSPKFKIEK